MSEHKIQHVFFDNYLLKLLTKNEMSKLISNYDCPARFFPNIILHSPIFSKLNFTLCVDNRLRYYM